MVSRRHFDQSQDNLRRLVDRIEVSLLVRDPGTALSADAYDGLRKAVMTAARERTTHLVQLAELSDAIDRGATIETLKDRAAEWSAQAGLERISSSDNADLFEITGGEGPYLQVEQPAWVDPVAGVLVKRGLASRTQGDQPTSVDLQPVDEPDPPVSEETSDSPDEEATS
jgi:hypothetical protein